MLVRSLHPGASKPIQPGVHTAMKPRPVEVFLSGAGHSGAKAGLVGVEFRTRQTSKFPFSFLLGKEALSAPGQRSTLLGEHFLGNKGLGFN